MSPRFLKSELSPSPVCVESRVRVRFSLDRTRIRVQQVTSPSPGVCGSSLNPSPQERKFPNSSIQGIFHSDETF